jgi:adenylate cyclase
MADRKKLKVLLWGTLGAFATILAIGLFLTGNAGGPLARLSYDAPFLFANRAPDDVEMVYLNRAAKLNLGEDPDRPLPRRYHARLIHRLRADGARLVLYDFIFEGETPDDPLLAGAIQRSGNVVLVSETSSSTQTAAGTEQFIPLAPGIAEAAAGVGLANLDRDEADQVVRLIYPGFDAYPAVGVVAAGLLGQARTHRLEVLRGRLWLRYYCPPAKLAAVNFDHALAADGLPKGFFKDKLVVVGAGDEIADQFRSPSQLRGKSPAPGAAFQAMSILNLWRGDWIGRRSYTWELAFIAIWGLLVSAVAMAFRPWNAFVFLALGSGVVAAFGVWNQLIQGLWWPWLVPAAAQSSVALGWSLGWHYLVESRRRNRLRRAFSAYLSPYMANRISEDDFDVALGGQAVEVTVVFTDLKDFTAMSETLDPGELASILTGYFNKTTRAILAEDGTIIKYIGDAVFAAWNAPLPDARHAHRATRAAWGMAVAGREPVAGRHLQTRVGINTGRVLAGNLGSDFRFDYTLIGDAVNLASRLEGLNKHLGTDVLLSEATRCGLGEGFVLRPAGRFILVGKEHPVEVHELLGLSEDSPKPAWLAEFAAGLAKFEEGALDAAEDHFRRVGEQRPGGDCLSRFYLKQIDALRLSGVDPASWTGVVRMEAK